MRTLLVLFGLLLLQATPPRPDVRLPAESAGWDAVIQGLLSTFDTADVLMLGEAHGRAPDAELRLRLIRHPAFAQKARFIVLEGVAANRQPLLDRYVSGGTLSTAERQGLGDAPTIRLLDAIREVNRTLSPQQQLRALGTALQAVSNDDRNAAAADIIENEVLERRGKALVVFGSGHVWHGEGGLTARLTRTIPGRVFVAEVITWPGALRRDPEVIAAENAVTTFERTLLSRSRPVLVSTRGAAGRQPAAPFYLGQAMLPENTTLQDLDDAVIYFDRASAAALDTTAGPRFRTAADLIELPVTVTDITGRAVAGLRAEDFAVLEDGRRQPLAFFGNEREPVSLGILLDASGSMTTEKLELAKASVARLVGEFLRPDDEFFLGWFGATASVTLEWTTDRTRLRQALRDIEQPTGDTRMYDAVDFALPIAQSGLHRKRALLILSDGRDTRSAVSVTELRRRVRATDVVVYAIGVEEESAGARGRVDAVALRRVTDDTGGRTEVVRGYAGLDTALQGLAADLVSQYRLAYAPDGQGRSGWRTIRVEVPGRRVRVRTRTGYEAPAVAGDPTRR